MHNKKINAIKGLVTMAMDLSLLRYPSFVYGKPLQNKETPPVLCLHTAMPKECEEWCVYIHENGISTLDADDYSDRIENKVKSNSNEVFLTFDDGHLSIWSVVEPLFRKYGLKATSFLIPGRVPSLTTDDSPTIRPTLEDVWSGNASESQISDPLRSGYELATWAENRIMHKRGVIDFQSHTLNHQLIAASDRIIGFVTPDYLENTHPFDIPAKPGGKSMDFPAQLSSTPLLGSPLFETAPRMSSMRACIPNPEITSACTEFVNNNGGNAFFSQPDWTKKLLDISSNKKKNNAAVYESDVEQKNAIRYEITECSRIIEQELDGKKIRHMAYPWGIGSEMATGLAHEAGLRTVYWGRVNSTLTNTIDTNPLEVARIGEDFFTLLPGTTRSSLTNIIAGKFSRRF